MCELVCLRATNCQSVLNFALQTAFAPGINQEESETEDSEVCSYKFVCVLTIAALQESHKAVRREAWDESGR